MDKANMNRRSFLKGALALGALETVGSLTACAPKSSSEGTTSDVDASTSTSETLLPSGENFNYYEPPTGDVAFVAESINPSDITDTLNCDVVVVGAGISGCSAAAAAAEEGLNVILLEKSTGYTVHGDYIAALDDNLHAANNMIFDKTQYLNDALASNGFRCDRTVWQQWLDYNGRAIDWAMEIGKDTCGGFYVTSPNKTFCGVTTWGDSIGITNGMSSLVEALLNEAIAQGVDVHYNTPACQLMTADDGKITGVIAKDGNDYIEIDASNGVVLATGSYEHNWDRMKQYMKPRDLAVYAWLSASLTDTGDGHMMGVAAGGVEDDLPHVMMNDPSGTLSHTAYSGIILPFTRVNEMGKRFVNESISLEYLCDALMDQPGAHDFVLLAGDMLTTLKGIQTDAPWTPEEMYESMKPDLIQADTIQELADKCGIDYESLQKTIDRQNELYDLGEDVDFGKEPGCLISYKEGPYYAVDEGGACLVTVSGLKINNKSEVLNAEGSPLGGLYAVGNCSGSMFSGTYPHHLSGISHSRCITFGYLIGKRLAGKIDE